MKRLWRSPVISGLLPQGVCCRIYPASFSESLCILFEPSLSWAVIVPRIMNVFSTVVVSDVVQISPWSLLLLFYVAFIVPSFPALRKHVLVADPVGLGIYIRVIIMLIA